MAMRSPEDVASHTVDFTLAVPEAKFATPKSKSIPACHRVGFLTRQIGDKRLAIFYLPVAWSKLRSERARLVTEIVPRTSSCLALAKLQNSSSPQAQHLMRAKRLLTSAAAPPLMRLERAVLETPASVHS